MNNNLLCTDSARFRHLNHLINDVYKDSGTPPPIIYVCVCMFSVLSFNRNHQDKFNPVMSPVNIHFSAYSKKLVPWWRDNESLYYDYIMYISGSSYPFPHSSILQHVLRVFQQYRVFQQRGKRILLWVFCSFIVTWHAAIIIIQHVIVSVMKKNFIL